MFFNLGPFESMPDRISLLSSLKIIIFCIYMTSKSFTVYVFLFCLDCLMSALTISNWSQNILTAILKYFNQLVY